MEFVSGRDLGKVVDDSLRTTGKVPDLEWTCRRLEELAAALVYCHVHGEVRRCILRNNARGSLGGERGPELDVLLYEGD